MRRGDSGCWRGGRGETAGRSRVRGRAQSTLTKMRLVAGVRLWARAGLGLRFRVRVRVRKIELIVQDQAVRSAQLGLG